MQAELCRFLCNRDNYNAYAKYVKEEVLAPEVADFIKVVGVMFSTQPLLLDVEPLLAKPFFIMRGKTKDPVLSNLLSAIDKADPDTYDPDVLIGDFIRLDFSNKLVDEVMKADGKPEPHKLKAILSDMEDTLSGITKADKHLITIDADTLAATFVRSGGYPWRLGFLNRAVGPVGGGDLVVVGARPETGKTSFITSEVTHMVKYLKHDESIVIFNNEEKGDKIGGRLVQSALNMTSLEVAADIKDALSKYYAYVGHKDRIAVYNRGKMSTHDVERFLKNSGTKYKIIVFNVLDKVHGFKDRGGNETERLRQLYQWARELASSHDALVIVVAQADATAENVKVIYQDQLYNSKTAIQGEADVLITIGALHGDDHTRYVNLPKNKIPATPGVDPALRHSWDEVHFDPDRGRYYDKRGTK